MKCIECGNPMRTKRENYLYRTCGLPNVTLCGVDVSRCSKCGEHEVAISHIEDLHRALALAVICKRSRLTPAEIRFLRKTLGYSGVDFASLMGVTPETVSRWEGGAQAMGTTAEKLLRLAVGHIQPAEEYPVERLRGLGIESPQPLRVSATRADERWCTQATAR